MSVQTFEWWQFGEDSNPYIDGEFRDAWQRGFVGEPARMNDDVIAYVTGQVYAKQIAKSKVAA
jgi:hypothetical protein